jgi:hypothetical protein
MSLIMARYYVPVLSLFGFSSIPLSIKLLTDFKILVVVNKVRKNASVGKNKKKRTM